MWGVDWQFFKGQGRLPLLVLRFLASTGTSCKPLTCIHSIYDRYPLHRQQSSETEQPSSSCFDISDPRTMAPAPDSAASLIGIANLPNQRHKIVAKRGAGFTIMVRAHEQLSDCVH